MNNNIEKEYKILVSKQQFDQLLSLYPNYELHDQINTYYDTYDHFIRSIKGAMRIRELNHHFIFTLKVHSGDDLLEFEKEVSSNDIRIFEDNEIKSLLSSYGINGPFYPISTLHTIRKLIRDEYCELCFDYNEYNNTIDYEIEYEYLNEHDGFTRFNKILSTVDLTYEKNCPSKIKRALNL